MPHHSTTDRLAAALAYCEVLNKERQQAQDTKKAQEKPVLKQQPKKQSEPLRDHVYVIKSSTGHYKIGISFHPGQRLKRLRHEASWARDLKLVHIITPRNAYGLEQKLHRHFAAQRVTGEWFLLTDQDVEWLQTQWPS